MTENNANVTKETNVVDVLESCKLWLQGDAWRYSENIDDKKAWDRQMERVDIALHIVRAQVKVKEIDDLKRQNQKILDNYASQTAEIATLKAKLQEAESLVKTVRDRNCMYAWNFETNTVCWTTEDGITHEFQYKKTNEELDW